MSEGIDGFSAGTRNVFLEIGRMVYGKEVWKDVEASYSRSKYKTYLKKEN